MNDWSKPQTVDQLTLVFPARITHLLPPYEEIPQEFKRLAGTPWNRWQARWFFKGLAPEDIPVTKSGIDFSTAMHHLATIQRSYEPKHEHKEAAVAYLASLWFSGITGNSTEAARNAPVSLHEC